MGRKRKVMNTEENKYLPPCRVCEGPAGGFHYGVNTCEACKGFFHRIEKGYQAFECESSGTCPVYYTNPKICKHCRYAKCLAVGMGKHAIKTGRYTVQKRTQDTLEIKKLIKHGGKTFIVPHNEGFQIRSQLEQYELREHYGTSSLSSSGSNSPITAYPSHSSSRLAYSKTSHPSDGYDYELKNSRFLPHSHSPIRLSPDSNNSFSFPQLFTSKGISSRFGDALRKDNFQDLADAIYEEKALIKEMYKDKDNVASIVYRGMEEHISVLPPYYSEEVFREKAVEHEKKCRARSTKYGSTASLIENEYEDVYDHDSQEPHNKRAKLDVEATAIMMEMRIRALAKFSKCIPGFNLVDMEDRITLVKHSRFEMLYVCDYFKVDPQTSVLLCGDGQLRCRHEMPNKPGLNARFQRYIDMWVQYQSLKLTDQEKALLAAIAMMAPDRPDQLRSPHQVEVIYEQLVDCLVHLFEKRCQKPLQLFSKVVNMMVRFRSYAFMLIRALKKTRFDGGEQNPLLSEMMEFNEIDTDEEEDKFGAEGLLLGRCFQVIEDAYEFMT